MIFTIVNPSDPYTIEASALDVAATVAALLGHGQYEFRSLDGGEDVPFFAFGGADDWCQKHFKESLMEMVDRVMATKKVEVADCCDSVLYGKEEHRKEFLESVASVDQDTREKMRFQFHDTHRSSMNDIGGRAYAMAKKLHGDTSAVVDPVPKSVMVR